VIDVSADVAKNPDFLLTPERIATWEKWNDVSLEAQGNLAAR